MPHFSRNPYGGSGGSSAPVDPREQKLADLATLQAYNNAGSAEDRAAQEASLRAMQQYYGIQHEQNQDQRIQTLMPEQLRQLQLGNDYTAAHTNYEDIAAGELKNSRNARQFQEEANAVDRLYPTGHPQREAMIKQTLAKFYPELMQQSGTATPPGAYGTDSATTTPIVRTPSGKPNLNDDYTYVTQYEADQNHIDEINARQAAKDQAAGRARLLQNIPFNMLGQVPYYDF